mgnify:CR=1 FL=1
MIWDLAFQMRLHLATYFGEFMPLPQQSEMGFNEMNIIICTAESVFKANVRYENMRSENVLTTKMHTLAPKLKLHILHIKAILSLLCFHS